MTDRPEFNPLRPMQHWIAILQRAGIAPNSDDDEAAAALPLPLLPLYDSFCRTRVQHSLAEGFLAFLERLQELDAAIPSKEELDQAPKLEKWGVAMRVTTICVFTGKVAGHLRIRDTASIFTSAVIRLDPDRQWGRSWNRYYRLGEYDAEAAEVSVDAGLLGVLLNLNR
ncbi:MAG: hypothetical protein IKD58_03625 [Loktanella sp.]|nr:hypothetical protein [Loktanella sp.]